MLLPETFSILMKSRQNRLIRLFIENGLPQFFDEISNEISNEIRSKITGANNLCTGISN